MAAKVYGNKSHIAFVEESTWGTPVTPPTKFVEITEAESFNWTREKKFIPTGNTRSVRHQVNGKTNLTGGFKTFLDYKGDQNLLFKHALGSNSTSAANGDGQYTHTVSLAEALPVGLTIYANRNSAVYGEEFQYPGCMVQKVTITQAVAEPAYVQFDFVGEGTQDEVTATATSFPAIEIADWNDLIAGTLTLNGSAVPMSNLEWSLENTLADDVYTLSAVSRADLKPDGERIVMASFDTFIEATDPVYALFTGDTEFATVITWKGPLIAGTSYNEFTINMARCRITDFGGFNGGTGGPIQGKVTIRAYANSSLNNECTVVIKNADSSL
jgi:hypothetical protein